MTLFQKTLRVTIFITIFFISSVFTKPASAQLATCNTFDFPSVQNNILRFFNCDSGEVQEFNGQNALVSISGQENLGGGVHSFVWSPDGKKAFVLSENVLAAVQTLKFYSSNRELNSLNWWSYDLDTDQATLLDKDILSLGWASNNAVIYNLNNKALYVSNADLSNPVKLMDIKGDSSDINDILASVSLGGVTIFPMEKGFYSVETSSHIATYFPLSGGIQKIITDPFKEDYFIIKSGSALYKFTVADKKLVSINDSFSADDMSFLNNSNLIIVGKDGKAYSYDISSKAELPIPLKAAGNIFKVFFLGNPDEFVFTIGKKIYKGKTDGSITLLSVDGIASSSSEIPNNNSLSQKQPLSTPANTATVNTTTANQSSADNSLSPTALITILVIVLVIIGVVLIYKRVSSKKNPSDKS